MRSRRSRPGTVGSYAKRLGVSHQRVSYLKRHGKLKMIGSDIDEHASARMHLDRMAAQRPSPSRQIKELYDAKMAKLEYEKAIGTLVEKADVQKEAFKIGRIIRDTLMGLPDRLAGVLASETDQKKIHALLTKELCQVLEVLATQPASGA